MPVGFISHLFPSPPVSSQARSTLVTYFWDITSKMDKDILRGATANLTTSLMPCVPILYRLCGGEDADLFQ